MTNIPVLSFNSGELSPQIDARSDVDKYRAGCRILENMIPRIYGTAERRPGTKFIDEQLDHTSPGRLVAFIYSNTIAYMILFEDKVARFYYNGGKVLDSWGRRLKIDTPYLAADLFQLQFKQSNDVMWIVHPNYAPRKLTRTSASSFSLNTITFTNGPFKKRNDLDAADGITMKPSVTTATGTLTASSAKFEANHVGALFKLTQPRAVTETSGSKTSPNTGVIGSEILVEGSFTFNTHGTWTGTVKLERNADGTNWETYRTYPGNDDRNIQFTGTEEEANVQYRINVTALNSGTINADLTVNSSTQDGICRITSFSNSTLVGITVLKNFASTNATVRWAEGCWSAVRGYPTSVTFYEERCVYAGTKHQPQTRWFSASGDFENFDECTKDNSAFSQTISSDTRNAIQWISGLESILMGTTGGEWRTWSGADDRPLTPKNCTTKQQCSYGSKNIQALPVNDVILFVDFVARKIRELAYSGEKYKYVAPDLTALAEHITETGIVCTAYQKNPDPILWMSLTDGTLVSMTYEREQNVIAFAKHPFSVGGQVESNAYRIPPSYPTLQIADGTWRTRQPDPELTHTTAISSMIDLQHMKDDLKGNYYLTKNIDASETSSWNAGKGFEPIGDNVTPFTGTLDGCGYTISGLVSKWSGLYFGIFREVGAGGVIANLTLSNVDMEGGVYSGAIVGTLAENNAKIQNCHVSGTITATGANVLDIGGIIGKMQGSTSYAYDCTTSVNIDAKSSHTDKNPQKVGGFVGEIDSKCILFNCRAMGTVSCQGVGGTAGDDVGGFFGYSEASLNNEAQIVDCSATGNVIGEGYAGGFAGESNNYTIISRCSARGNVTTTAGDCCGGFAALIGNDSVVSDCYAWGNVNAGIDGYAGGFVQYLYNGSISNVYSVGTCTGTYTGGLVQYNDDGTITNSFWDKEASGEEKGVGSGSQSGGLEGHSTAWMKTQKNFEDAGYDFDTVWSCPDPVLWSASGLGSNSVAVIPSSAEDEVWVLVARVIGGEVKRYVEQMQPRNFGEQEDAWFVDSGLSYNGDPEDTFAGLGHLEGETVKILGDGAVFSSQIVTNGTVTLDNLVSKAVIGLPFTFKLKPMRFDLTTEYGTSKGSIKKISELVISFYRSLLVKYGRDEDNLFDIDWRTTEAYGEPPALYTGDKVVTVDGGFDVEDSVLITGDSPLPCIIRAIVPRLEQTGR